jgi:L-iditol 2-dehydrogenase
MKAAVYLGPEKIEVRDLPKPDCGAGEILIKVEACAICGTDVRIFCNGQKNVVPPTVTGHEIAGTIEQVGKDVSGYDEGSRAIVVTPVGCGRCKFCRAAMHNLCLEFKAIGYDYAGGFAEYVLINTRAVQQGNVIVAPDSLEFDEGSLIEPLSCCINGAEYLNITLGDTAVIIGAGPIGCMHAELAKSYGATKVIIIDTVDERVDLAKQATSADVFINAAKTDPVEAVLEQTDGAGADVIITACSAHVPQQQALKMAAKRGRISFFAGLPKDKPTIEFDSNLLHYRELSVFGAFASHATDYVRAMALIASRKIDARKLITKRIPLERIVEGFETSRSGHGLKVVVQP